MAKNIPNPATGGKARGAKPTTGSSSTVSLGMDHRQHVTKHSEKFNKGIRYKGGR